MSECKHHYCMVSCLYGGNNTIVTSKIVNADPNKRYQGVLCCKCRAMTIIPEGDKLPDARNDKCNKRWDEFEEHVMECYRLHGPLGG